MSRNGAAHQQRDVFVLSGGASRGAVQVGMMEVLFAHGIVPDAFVGTSVGALNSAFVAWDPCISRVHELRERWLRLQTHDIFPGGTITQVTNLIRQRPYLFSNAALAGLIDDWLPARRLEDLEVPVRVTTTPLGGDCAVYHSEGEIRPLLLASAAVPAVFAPVELPETCGHPGPHVDGGVTDLIPIRGAVELAPTRVWVLDASLPAREPRGRSPLDILVASFGVAMRVTPEPDLGPDVEVHRITTPDRRARMTDFAHTAQHIADGRAAAARLLEELEHPVVPLAERRGSREWRPLRVA
jgi:NTE family protein